jgi:hypothetical protein
MFCFHKAAHCFSFKSPSPNLLLSFTILSLYFLLHHSSHIFSDSKNPKMKYFSLTAIVLAATIVNAQAPDACILNCATATCPEGLSNLNCFCVTGTAAISACIKAQCTATDFAMAAQLGASVCGTKLN